MRDLHYFTEYLPNLMSTVFEGYYSCVFVSLIKFTYFDSGLAFFDFDILSLIRKDIYFFVLVFHFDYSAKLRGEAKRFRRSFASAFAFVFAVLSCAPDKTAMLRRLSQNHVHLSRQFVGKQAQ